MRYDYTHTLNVQLVTLPNLCVVDYVMGHTGISHDSSVFGDFYTARNSSEFFTPGSVAREVPTPRVRVRCTQAWCFGFRPVVMRRSIRKPRAHGPITGQSLEGNRSI